MGLLDPRGLEVFQDHPGEIHHLAIFALGVLDAVDQFVILVHPQDAVGREALDGERPGHADRLFILVGFVVEVLELGLGGDGGVDLLLAGDTLLPPLGVKLFCFAGPSIRRPFR